MTLLNNCWINLNAMECISKNWKIIHDMTCRQLQSPAFLIFRCNSCWSDCAATTDSLIRCSSWSNSWADDFAVPSSMALASALSYASCKAGLAAWRRIWGWRADHAGRVCFEESRGDDFIHPCSAASTGLVFSCPPTTPTTVGWWDSPAVGLFSILCFFVCLSDWLMNQSHLLHVLGFPSEYEAP